jgi:hypothetical protein
VDASPFPFNGRAAVAKGEIDVAKTGGELFCIGVVFVFMREADGGADIGSGEAVLASLRVIGALLALQRLAMNFATPRVRPPDPPKAHNSRTF